MLFPLRRLAKSTLSIPHLKANHIGISNHDLLNCVVKMPRPFNPHQLGTSRGPPSHRRDSTAKSAPVGLRRGETPSNSGSFSRAFSTPMLSPQKIPSPQDGSVRTESPLVLNPPIPEPRIEPIERGHIQSESNDGAFESRSVDGIVDENEIVMAVDMREQQTIGCAYYAASEEKLYLMQDCKFADLTLFDTRTSARWEGVADGLVKLHIAPTTVIAPSRVSADVYDCLNPEKDRMPSAEMDSTLRSDDPMGC